MKPSKGLLIGGTVVLVIILIVLVLPFFIDANQFRPTLERQLQTTLGRSVQIGDLSISLIAGGVRAKDVSIAEDPHYGSDPFLKTKSLDVGVDFLPLSLVIYTPGTILFVTSRRGRAAGSSPRPNSSSSASPWPASSPWPPAPSPSRESRND